MVLSEKLAALRKKHGYSQLHVAECLNVSRQAISRWEVGSSVPSTENLMELSRLYGVSLDELVGYDTKEKVSPTPDSQTVYSEQIPEQQKIGIVNAPKKKSYIVIAVVCITILCLLMACLWCVDQIQGQEDLPIQYEDMSNGGSISPDGSFVFE